MVRINGLPFISPTLYYPDTADYYYIKSSNEPLIIPYGVKSIEITLIGGGGGGAIVYNNIFAGSGGGSGYIQHYTLTKNKDFNAKDILTAITVGSGGAAATASTGNGSNGGSSEVVLVRSDGTQVNYTAAGGQGAKRTKYTFGDYSIYLSNGGNGGFGGGGAAPAWYNTLGESYGGVGGYGGTMEKIDLTPGPGAYSMLTNDAGQYVQYNGSYVDEGIVWMPDRYSGGGAPVKGDEIITSPSICVGDGRFHLFRSRFADRDNYSKLIAGSVRDNDRAFCCMFQDLDNSLYYLGPGGNGGQAYAYENSDIQGTVLGAYGGGYLNANLEDEPPLGTACGSGGRGQGVGTGSTEATAGTNGVIGIRMIYRENSSKEE